MARASGPLGVEAFAPALAAREGEPDWLAAYRAAGRSTFETAGLPTNRQEAWKYTSLRPLARGGFLLPEDAANEAVAVPAPLIEGAAQAVFANGRFSPSLSDLDGLDGKVLPILQADAGWLSSVLDAGAFEASQPMYALNAAAFDDGLAIRIGAGEALARPLEIVYLAAPGGAPAMWHPRLAVEVGQGARATIVERHMSIGEGAYLANHGADIVVGAAARLTHAKIQAEGAEGRHLAMTRVRVAEEALFDNFVLTSGAALSRNELAVNIGGADSEVRLNGAYAIGDRQLADHTSRIDHAAPSTVSKQVFAGAINDSARGVFQGHIVVDRVAQQTDGHQLNRALLLSDKAEIDSKPILEIYADDVKCSHGATAGDIDEDQLFYLRARGVPAEMARRLVVRGFLAEAADGIGDDDVRTAVLGALDDALGMEQD